MTTTPTSPTSARSELLAPRGFVTGPSRGFTMIELIVVVAIVAIVFAAVRPALTGLFRGARERSGLRGIVGILSFARTEAVARGRLVRVLCDLREGVLWAERQVDPAVDRSQFELQSVLGRSQVRLPEVLTITDLTIGGQGAAGQPFGAIYFYPDGHTDGASLSLIGASGRGLLVELSPTTGRVTISA